MPDGAGRDYFEHVFYERLDWQLAPPLTRLFDECKDLFRHGSRIRERRNSAV